MLDLTKPITTRRGQPVRVVCADTKCNAGPLAVLITDREGHEILRSYNMDGHSYWGAAYTNNLASGDDLINARTKVKRWKVTIDPDLYGLTDTFETKRGYFLYHSSDYAIFTHSIPTPASYSRQLAQYVLSVALVDVYEDELGDGE